MSALAWFGAQIAESYTEPTRVIARILRTPLEARTILLFAALIAVGNGIGFGLFSETGGIVPIMVALLGFAMICFSAFVIWRAGASFGGNATFQDCWRLSIWHQAVFFLPEMLVLALSRFAEPGLLAIAFYLLQGWSLVVLARFIQAAHGFVSFPSTLFGVIAIHFIIALPVAAVILQILGV